MMTFNEDKHYFSNYSTLNDELPDFDRILTKQLRHEKAHQLLMDVNDVNRQYAHENCMFESMERVERDHYQKRGEQFTHTSQSQAIHHLRENEERARHVLSTSFPQSVEEAHLERKSLREEFIKSVENFHNRLNESMNTLQEFNRLYTEHLSALRNLEQAMQWLNADLLSKTRQNQFQQCIKTCPARETINQIKNSISALDAVGMENTGKKLLEELKQLQEINNIDGFPVYFADNWEQLHERVFQFANQRSSILDEIEKLCQSHVYCCYFVSIRFRKHPIFTK
jgi:hypothetical protein